MGVHFDGYEAAGAAGAAGNFGAAKTDETSAGAAANDSPLGIFGFSLGFRQMACA